MRLSPLPLALCLGLSACMVGPDYQRPVIDTPAAYRFADKEARNLSNTLWWEQFQDPVLDELIRTALAENKDIKIAAARVEEFQGRYGETRSLLFPQVSAGTQGQRTRSPRDNGPVPLDSSIDPIFNNYQATLGIGWELDIWGRLRRLS
ncbi:Outer membrane protein OprM precursor [compost metagenome]